ncbi:hypothetical protein MMC16_002129 [Acarospora aff. strigata]|nr:hypothetical protein [Acarospora aff. strigata]
MPKHDYAKREELIQKALVDFQSKKSDTITGAAVAHGVPKSTLFHRIQGRRDRATAHQHVQLLNPEEEEVLCQQILLRCRQGWPPRKDAIRDMAIAIIQGRDRPFTLDPDDDNNIDPSMSPTTQALVGKEWPDNFLKRHPATKGERTKALMKDRRVSNRKETTEERYRRSLKRIIENPTLLPTVKEQLEEVSEQVLSQIDLLERENNALREALALRKERASLEQS